MKINEIKGIAMNTDTRSKQQSHAKNVYFESQDGFSKVIVATFLDEETFNACLPYIKNFAEKENSKVSVFEANEKMDDSENLVLAYFESGFYGEFAGLFRNESVYEVCITPLEAMAEEADMIVTESVNPDEDVLEDFFEELNIEDTATKNVTKIECELEDKSGEPFEKTNLSVELVNGAIQIKAKGYGDNLSADDDGVPIIIEQFNGELRVVVWGDINQEDATDIISLEGAKEIKRESESDSSFEMDV